MKTIEGTALHICFPDEVPAECAIKDGKLYLVARDHQWNQTLFGELCETDFHRSCEDPEYVEHGSSEIGGTGMSRVYFKAVYGVAHLEERYEDMVKWLQDFVKLSWQREEHHKGYVKAGLAQDRLRFDRLPRADGVEWPF